MKPLPELIKTLQYLKPRLQKEYSVSSIGVFGSYIRNEQRGDSDLDLLVTFYDPPGLFKYIQLENYLSDTLGIKVDLVMENALKSTMKSHILEEVRRI